MANIGIPFKVLTLNVHGFRNSKTRKSLFRQFRLSNFDAISLQETYLTDEFKVTISNEWQGLFHFSAGTSHSKGLLTLFNKSVQSYVSDPVFVSERVLLSKLCINDETIFLANVYAPCDSLANRINFLYSTTNILNDLIYCDSYNNPHVILLGDFNATLDNRLDIISGNPHPPSLVDAFNHAVNDISLNDIFRLKNPNEKTFTWTQKKFNEPRVSRRLDYIFISDSLLPFALNVNISNFGFSDHRAVALTLDFVSFKRGPSIYKLNKELLKNHVFVKTVKFEIYNFSQQFSESLNPILKWEYIKSLIRGLGIVFGKKVSVSRNCEKKSLESTLATLETKLCNEGLTSDEENKLAVTKTKMETIIMHEARGAQLRAGIRYAELGEKNNHFFLSLEKQRSANNTITKLSDNNGVLSTPDSILSNIMNYYENIYKNPKINNSYLPDIDNCFLKPCNLNILQASDKERLDFELTMDDILDALKHSKNDSAPGLDGLPIEVYKFFWNDIKFFLFDCFKYSFQTGSLSPSQCDALICLLHKNPDLKRDDLANWRPIALLNADYKILAKVLARRLQSVIDGLIDQGQSAFIKGRGASTMLRELYDIIERAKTSKSPSIILSIDYSKAFDKISTGAILKALKVHGFGEYFYRWIQILLKDRKCCVRNAGYISKTFAMERGVRQGCPISPMLFILTSELFAAHIRANNNIKGIYFPNSRNSVKIRLFADDITLFFQDLIDYREVLAKIKLFTEFSGLELNKNKSFAMYFGNNDLVGTFMNGIKFVERLKILGVIFSLHEDARDNDDNFKNRIKSLEKVCALWARRQLSEIGKIVILKAFGLSLFVHLMQSIGIKKYYLKLINTIMYRFIWKKNNNNKKVIERVGRNIICNRYHEGGLCMTNLACFQSSILLGWAEKLLNIEEPANWKIAAEDSLREVGGASVFKSTVLPSQFKGLMYVKNSFWREVISVWLNFNKSKNDATRSITPDSPLFNNAIIKFKNVPLYFQECISKKVIVVKDVIIGNKIIEFNHFKSLVNSPNSFLMYYCIVNALKPHIATIEGSTFQSNKYQITFCDTEVGEIGRKGFYHLLLHPEEPHVEQYWSRKMLVPFDKGFWLNAINATKETRLRILHWKILMNLYPTSIILKRMKLRNSDLCQICNVQDTMEHFFFSCSLVNKVWVHVNNIINIVLGHRNNVDWKSALFGFLSIRDASKQKIKLINLIILLAKLSISKAKYGKQRDPYLILENELRIREIKIW